jgi:lipid IVA palmitoyltransferase
MLFSVLPRWGWRLATLGVVVAIISGGATARANPASDAFGELFSGKVAAVSDAVRIGNWETYFTGYAWHLPYGYQATTRARLNETTWGGGFGRTIDDEDGDRHSVYLMGFSDSHRALQVNAGYAWQRYWSATRDVKLGAGYLAFFFSREDVANHLPIPAVLPCLSLRYRGLEMIGLFVPRVSRDIKGDVLFVYLRVPLGTEPTMKRFGSATSGRPRR